MHIFYIDNNNNKTNTHKKHTHSVTLYHIYHVSPSFRRTLWPHKEKMEDETFDTIYGTCKADTLRSDGTLVVQIMEWTLANGDHPKMYISTNDEIDDEVRFFFSRMYE